MDGIYYNRAKNKAEKHSQEMKSKTIKNNVLNIINIALVSFAGVSNNIVSLVGTENTVFSYIFSGVLYCSLLTAGIQSYFKLSEDIERHRISALLYSVLCENINDEIIPVQYIRSQFQMLKAFEPNVNEVDFDHLDVLVKDDSRDLELEFELRKLRRNV